MNHRSACWCGDQHPWVRHKTKDSSCNVPCSGDKSKKCGDYWRLSVYSTGQIGNSFAYMNNVYLIEERLQ